MKRILGKMLVCMLALLLFLGAEIAAQAETAQGMVIGFSEEGIVLYADGNIRTAMILGDTVYDTEGELHVGDVVTVSYDGCENGMPIAETVACHRLHGIITDIVYGAEPYLMFMPFGGEAVRVNLTEAPSDSLAAGVPVTVYYNGMRTRSVPAQITAQYIRGTMLAGTVTDLTDGSMRLLTESGETVILHSSGDTVIPTEIKVGNVVWASVAPPLRLSLPAQYEAQDIMKINER